MVKPRTTRSRPNPLDVPDRLYGQNPRALSAAARRSSERTGVPSARPQPMSHAVTHPSAGAKRKKTIVAVTEATGRKGGPGKRRPTPKKGRGHRR